MRPAIARVIFWVWIRFDILNAMGTVWTAFDDPRLIPGNLVALVAAWDGQSASDYWAVSLDARTASLRSGPRVVRYHHYCGFAGRLAATSRRCRTA